MQFFGETHIHFSRLRYKAFILSGIFIVAGLVSLAIKGGPRLSIDFEGGTLIQVRFDQPVPIGELRQTVKDAGYDGGDIQEFGAHNEYLITIEKISEAGLASEILMQALEGAYPKAGWQVLSSQELPPDISAKFEGGNLVIVSADSIPPIETLKSEVRSRGVGVVELTKETSTTAAFSLPYLGVEAQAVGKITNAMKARFPDRAIEIRRTESVGPKIGEELKNRTWAAILISLFGILVYISWRFEFKFAVGAILALVHDVVITVGLFSILNKEISLVIVAALLTIVGYSLNDTIVVFDRIRENFSLRRRESYESMIDISINESLSRTIITSLTTLIVVVFLFLFGGEVIHDFAFALLVGIVVGTYSSIFVASPILIEWQNRLTGRKKAVAQKATAKA
jgi:preprotein translocase subunit SecF